MFAVLFYSMRNMKKRTPLLTIIMLLATVAIAQPGPVAYDIDSLYAAMPTLEALDAAALSNVPKLKLSQAERNIPLPVRVNNAERPWMPPIFYQAALECGQASSICYTLSYELARRRNQTSVWSLSYQYPSHFAWNFCNEGHSRGVAFMESWNVIRTAGTPNVTEWGGWYSYGGASRWISGYETYHSAMKNRISEMYAIPIDDEDGLLTLKHWLNDHLAGEASGGLANFYCTYLGNDHLVVIPPGNPSAGKHLLPQFTSNVNHAKTIVGYDDEVRWDYNGDGQYTNNIDINNDGVVNMQDWEIGAVIFCNTFGTQFGDNGYCYLPYCKLATLPANGGIWNKCVYVVQVRDEVFPQVTYKATIRHNSRDKIKLTAGIANNTNASQPEHILDFFVFNYQGGDLFMQGDNEVEEGKTLELGLDISPLLNYAIPNTPCKFFLMVTENDPDHVGEGAVVNFSVMDYTSGSEVEQACSSTNVAIADNSTTTLSVVRAINFSKPEIQDTVLPSMEAFVPYTHALTATNGKPPYRWEVSRQFEIDETGTPYPTESGQTVTLSNASSGYAIVNLPFDFPYYGDNYNQIVVYADGYIAFHHQPANWPFLQYSDLQTMAIRSICPFKADLTNSTVRKIVDGNSLTLVFNAKLSGQTSSSLNFAVTLHATGEIEFLYGDMSFTGNSFWSALVRGDQKLIQHTPASGQVAANIAHRSFSMTPSILPDCLTLSTSGILTGKSERAFDDVSFSVTCYDNNDVATTQKVHISSLYTSRLLMSSLKINGSETPNLFVGDTLNFTVSVFNTDTLPYSNGILYMRSTDPFVSFIDSTEYFGYIGPGNEYTLNNCVKGVVKRGIPDGHEIPFSIEIANDIASITATRVFSVHSYDFSLLHYAILNHGNNAGMLHPIELDTLLVTLRNNKGEIHDVELRLRSTIPEVEVPIATKHFDTIAAEATFELPAILYVTPAFITGTTFNAYVDIYVDGVLVDTKTVTVIGETTCFDFEDGAVPAQLTGGISQGDWLFDNSSGRACLRSGNISHNDTSTVQIEFTSVQGEHLMFAFRTSTENKYDWLYFFIDNVQQGRWSGLHDWTNVHYPVEAGSHTAVWKYIKDYNTDSNEDHVWIDDICFAEFDDHSFELDIHPESVEVTMGVSAHTGGSALVTLESTFAGIVLFNNVLEDADGLAPTWVTCTPGNDFIDANGQQHIVLHFNSYGCSEEDHHATLRIRHTGGERLVPVTMHVSCVGIPTVESPANIKVYPNPTRGNVFIQHENAIIERVAITDLSGRTVAIIPVNDHAGTLDLSSLPIGLYLLRIEQVDGTHIMHKIIKE